eukprot:4697642-Karenia_brevis.AAC.1
MKISTLLIGLRRWLSSDLRTLSCLNETRLKMVTGVNKSQLCDKKMLLFTMIGVHCKTGLRS